MQTKYRLRRNFGIKSGDLAFNPKIYKIKCVDATIKIF
jgi:hypothetical protein